MSGIVGSRFNTRGSGLVGSLGTDGQVFTSSGAGAGAVFEAAASGGITYSSLWRVNTQFTGKAIPIVDNWEEYDAVGSAAATARIGSAFSAPSSGIWTFPATGIWFIQFSVTWNEGDNVIKQTRGRIKCSRDGGSNMHNGAESESHMPGENYTATWNACFMLWDVEDTSNDKVQFEVDDDDEDVADVLCDTNDNRTYAMFIRLGDT